MPRGCIMCPRLGSWSYTSASMASGTLLRSLGGASSCWRASLSLGRPACSIGLSCGLISSASWPGHVRSQVSHLHRHAHPLCLKEPMLSGTMSSALMIGRFWPFTVVPPLAACCGSSGPSIALQVAAQPCTPLQAAAKQGFKGLSQTWLDKVAGSIGCSFEAGGVTKKTVLCKVEALIRHILPDASDDEVHAYMQIRNPKGFNSWLHSDHNLEQVEGVLDSTDKKAARDECQDELSRRTARVQAAESKASKGVASGSGSGSSSLNPSLEGQSGGTKRKAKVVTGTARGSASQQSRGVCQRAEQYLPRQSVGRCFFQPYISLRRVQVYYPRDAYPKSFSRMWAQDPWGVCEADAVKACLRWAWACHTENTGIGYPHNINGLVL